MGRDDDDDDELTGMESGVIDILLSCSSPLRLCDTRTEKEELGQYNPSG